MNDPPRYDKPLSSLPFRRRLAFARRTPERHSEIAVALRDCARALWTGAALEKSLCVPWALGEEFVNAADFHRVTPGLHVLLRHVPGIPEAVSSRCARAHADQLARHIAALAGLESVESAASAVGAPWIVLKGPYLAEAVWPRPDLRASYDLDVLVAAPAVPAMLEQMLTNGAVVPRHDWVRLHREKHAQVSLLLPSGVVCDLHWELLAIESERRGFELPASSMFARAKYAQLGAVRAPVPALEDALIHVALHASLAASGRLVWLLDIAYLVAAGPDWATVIARARASGAALPLAVVLHRADALLDLALPAGTLDALAPRRSWRALLAAIDRYRPVETGFRRKGMGRLVIASTRRDTAASMSAAVVAAKDAVRHLGRTPKPGPSLYAPARMEDLAAARTFVRNLTSG